MLSRLRLYLRLWLWKHQLLLATLVTGTFTVLCFFVIPVEAFGAGFLAPEGRVPGRRRGLASAFALNYLFGLVNAVAFIVLAVELLFPEEWVAVDGD